MNPLPEERELARLEKSQDDAQERVATLELELETLKSETSKFQHHYNRTIGKLYVEIDEWRARIARARAGQSSGDSAAEQEAAEAEARAQDSAREAGLIEDDPEPSLQITPELRHAYRQAAKLVHPDRATTESERIRRTEVMQRVNLAYKNGDETAIQKIISDFGQDPEEIKGLDVASRIVKAIRRIAQLDRRSGEIEQEIAALKASEIYEFKVAVEESEEMGGDPLGELASELLKELSGLKLEYERLPIVSLRGSASNA